MQLEDDKGALSDLDEAIRLDPTDPSIHLIKGIALGLNGDLWHGLGEWVAHPLVFGQIKLKVRFN